MLFSGPSVVEFPHELGQSTVRVLEPGWFFPWFQVFWKQSLDLVLDTGLGYNLLEMRANLVAFHLALRSQRLQSRRHGA